MILFIIFFLGIVPIMLVSFEILFIYIERRHHN